IDVVGNCNRLRTTKPECSVDEHERRWGAGKGKRGKVGIEYRGHGRPLVDGEYIKLSSQSGTRDRRICTARECCITNASAHGQVESAIVDHVAMEYQYIGDDCARACDSKLSTRIHVEVSKHFDCLCCPVLKAK